MKLVNGLIPKNTTCSYSDMCTYKKSACNGNGCPVSDGKTIENEFSCALARLINTIKG